MFPHSRRETYSATMGRVGVLALFSPLFARAAGFGPPTVSGFPAGTLLQLIEGIIRASLALVGILALGFVVYGGFKYMMARGEEQELEKAKQTITQAVIAVVIIGLAYAIVQFAFGTLGVD